MESRSEPLQVDRDRELEAVETLGLTDGIALDRTGHGVTHFETERVGRSRDQEVERGTPRRAHRRAYERAHVGAEGYVAVDPDHGAPAERGPRAGLAQGLRGDASGALQRHGSARPISPQFAVRALREQVVGGGQGDVQALAAFGPAPRPPAGEHLRLVAWLGARARFDQERVRSEL